MSDAARKPMTDKITEAITPESSKSTTEKAKEGITDLGDKGARGAQPDSHKSGTQEAADKLGRSKDQNTSGGTEGSVLDSAKKAIGMDKK